MEFVASLADSLDRAAGAAMLPLALWIVISGFDDLVIASAYLWVRLSGRLPIPKAVPDGGQRELRVAIFVPLWQEDRVVAGMLDHNLAAIKYRNFEFFVGAYPNDAGTVHAVRSVAARSPRVHLALCPHDGPTSKADCMNWIYQRMLQHEGERGVEFDMVVTHDAEDLIHPDELRLMNSYAADYDMIQVPVLPLPTPVRDWSHGIYCDDFAEFHTKDLPARWWLGGFIPSCGVGTAFTRQALEALAAADTNLVFRPDCLTEDYETGYRLHKLGFQQLFVPICQPVRGKQSPVATREYFPRRFGAALRQRTRWTTGIALQAWARHGWGSTWADTYWFLHDRKGLVGNPASLAANLILIYGGVTWAASAATGSAWGLGENTPSLVAPALPFTAAIAVLLASIRAVCSASIYGWAFAALSPLRSISGNLLNSMAAGGALYRFVRWVWFGHPLVWLKTEHAYPSLAALDIHKPPLEQILVGIGAVAQEAVQLVRGAQNGLSIPERLLERGLITEDVLLEALMLRHNLGGGEVPANGVKRTILRMIPPEVDGRVQALPIALRGGVVQLACPDIPSESALDHVRRHLRLPFELHLVTRRNFEALARLTDS